MLRPHPKPEKKERKKRKGLKRTRKKTGEADLNLRLWEEREHRCVNCKAYLGDTPHTYNFAHLIRKGKDGSKRLDPDNLIILCFECHQQMDQGTKAGYDKRKDLYAEKGDTD